MTAKCSTEVAIYHNGKWSAPDRCGKPASWRLEHVSADERFSMSEHYCVNHLSGALNRALDDCSHLELTKIVHER